MTAPRQSAQTKFVLVHGAFYVNIRLMRGDRISGRKKLLIFAPMMSLPVLFPVALVLGYYTYRTLASPIRVTGSFGELDAELGRRLKP